MINDISNKLVSSSQNVKAEALTPGSVKPESVTEESDLIVEQQQQETPRETALVNIEKIDNAVEQLNNIVQNIERDLNFRVDEASGKTIVTVLDSKTEEVIRQIPADHVLAVSENIENLKGILFSAEV